MEPLDDQRWYFDMMRVEPDADLGGITGQEMADYHARPPVDPEGSVWMPEVEYHRVGDRPLRLWLYGRRDPAERRPGVLFVHGGGWIGGHPFMHLKHIHALAERGWVGTTIEYRRYPEATWPAALEDAKTAMRWMRAHADEIGLDPSRLAVAGGSAGGHLAAMVALTPGRFEGDGPHQDERSGADATVAWYPVTDLHCDGVDDLRQAAVDFLGTDAEAVTVEASPITYVTPGVTVPPLLTITGDADETTKLEPIQEFHDALGDVGADHELEVVADRIHGWDFAPGEWERSFERFFTFLDARLGAGAGADAGAPVAMA